MITGAQPFNGALSDDLRVAVPEQKALASGPSRPVLVPEDLLLYDKDGQSLLDDHALRILIAVHQEKLTAQEIAFRYKVPIAACYRRVRRLLSLGLVSEAGFVTEGRRRPARLYKSEVERFQVQYGSGQMSLKLTLRNGVEAATVVRMTPDADAT